MYTPYVCSRCSRQLLRSKSQLRNASFVSLGKLVDRNATQAETQEVGATTTGDLDVSRAHRKKRQSFARQYQELRKPVGVDKVLETLFSSTRAHEQASQISRYSRTPKGENKEHIVEDTMSERSIYRRLLELHNLLKRGTSRIEYIWTSCQQLLSERIWRRNRDLSDDEWKKQRVVFHDILLAICSKQRLLVHNTNTIVTPGVVIQTYMKHEIMGHWWHEVIWSQIGQLMRLKLVVDGKTEEEAREAKTLAQDLLEVWSIFREQYQNPKGSLDFKINITDLASHESKDQKPTTESLENRFWRLMNKYPDGSLVNCMATAAITTHMYCDAENVPCAPLLGNFFAQLHRGRELDLSTTRTRLSDTGIETEIIGKIIRQLEAQQLKDKHDIIVSKRDELRERKYKQIHEWSLEAIEKRRSEVNVALKRKDPEGAVTLWDNFVDYLDSGKPKDKDTNSRVFAEFLRTFWVVRCSNQAIAVWNYMVNYGQSPAQRHWSAMLSGCIGTRDPTSLQHIWRNMLRSKFTPDIETWSIYIHGLIRLGKWQEGLEALETLGRLWKGKTGTDRLRESVTTQKDTDPLNPNVPNIRPVRSALSALTVIGKHELHATVVAWAESQNLRLDTSIFNILLQPLVRHGTQAQVQSHLQQMAAHDCSPDVTTLTIILNGLVSNKDSSFHSMPPEAQERTIMSVLGNMKDKGLPANTYTFTILLDGLLNPKSPKDFYNNSDAETATQTSNVPAARTILKYMKSHRIPPSPHHYTILISHYFACKPPDLASVATLWAGLAESGQTALMDDVFYDRMIEGYANHDEIEKALQFLRIVPREGKRPSWWALFRTLAALERRGEWGLCGELMEDIEDPKGLLRHGPGVFRGKRQFYELVDELRGRGVAMGGAERI